MDGFSRSKAAESELVFVASSGKGIYACHLNLESGELTTNGLAGEMKHASFLAVHPNHEVLYAVGEAGAKDSSVVAFSIQAETSKLTLLNKLPSGGAGPCHLCRGWSGEKCFGGKLQ